MDESSVTLNPNQDCPLTWGWYLKVMASVTLLVAVAGSPYWLPTQGLSFPGGQSGWGQILAGQLLALSGLAFYGLSYYKLRSLMKGTLSCPETLVTEGFPWSRIRHPMYLADLWWTFGMALILPPVLGLSLWVLLAGGAIVQAREEDRFLARQFPETHCQWSKQTGLIFPRFRRG
jgi:protein-S-isoprenylcysteine O-methyltransferase Ste14